MDFLNLLISKHLLRFMCIPSTVNSANIYDKLSLHHKKFSIEELAHGRSFSNSLILEETLLIRQKKKFHSRKIKFLNDWVSKLKVRPSVGGEVLRERNIKHSNKVTSYMYI